jgi:hypothetical protein
LQPLQAFANLCKAANACSFVSPGSRKSFISTCTEAAANPTPTAAGKEDKLSSFFFFNACIL